MGVANKTDYIRVRWSERDRKTLLVEDECQDRFCMAIDEAIEACKVHNKRKHTLCGEQFRSLLDLLGRWCSQRRKKIARALLTVRDAGLLLLIVTRRKTYDPQFEDELTQLDLQIANSPHFSEISLSVQALPMCGPDSYAAFCNPETTLEYVRVNG